MHAMRRWWPGRLLQGLAQIGTWFARRSRCAPPPLEPALSWADRGQEQDVRAGPLEPTMSEEKEEPEVVRR